MDNKTNCFVTIRSYYPSMFDAEKRIADFILNQPDKFVNMTVAQVAREIGVSDSSIIRFCQKLNYDGFTQLKINIARNMKKPADFIMEDIEKDDTPFSVVSKVFASNIRALDETLAMISKEELSRAVNLILQAERIEFYGVGTSANLAIDAYYRFMRIGMPAYAATDPHIMRLSASMLNNKCAAIGISHTGRTIDTVRTLEIAKSKGAGIICITSFMKSPIIEISDIKLVTSTPETKIMKEAVSTRIAHIALLDSLYAYVALKKYDTAMVNIGNITDILNEMRF